MLSYRIKHIFHGKILRLPENIQHYILYEKLIHIVYIHRRAMELVSI